MIENGKNLTGGFDQETLARLSQTFPGMASWALPESGKACYQCRFWGSRKTFNYEPTKNTLAPQGCRKFSDFSHGYKGALVPFNAYACRYFEANKNAPTPMRQAKS